MSKTKTIFHEEPATEGPAAAVPEFGIVDPGDSAHTFAERHGVHVDRVLQLNDAALAAEARARGFDTHRFTRRYGNEDGSFSDRPDYHVFGGMRLRLQEPQE
jgi:hypothetical protein